MAKKGKTKRPAVRKPKNPTADPVMQALVAKVTMLFAERCDALRNPPDPDSKDFWRLMTYSFVFEHLMAEHRPPAKGKKTKPVRWTDDEKRRLLGQFRKVMAGGKRAGGKTVTDAAEDACPLQARVRQSGKPHNAVLRSEELAAGQDNGSPAFTARDTPARSTGEGQ